MATGTVIAALVAALIFEISHSLTIYNEWRFKQREIDRLEGSFKQLKVDYFHQTGKQFEATDFKEGEIIDLMEMRESGKLEHFKDRLQDAVQPEPSNPKRKSVTLDSSDKDKPHHLAHVWTLKTAANIRRKFCTPPAKARRGTITH